MSLIAHSLSEKERTEDVLLTEEVSFNALLLSEEVSKGLTKNGFVKPSPIQLKAIPLGKCGFDLIIQSKSGTGKTAVFAIIALEMIDITRNDLQVLIVAPTREIAVQIQSVIQAIGSLKEGLKVEVFIGGLPIEDDIQKAKECHIAVGTPGRLKKLIEDEHLKVNTCRLFVLDEADKLVESSLQADINFMYHKLPKRKQTLALSATYNDNLQEFLSRYMRSPTYVSPSANRALLLGLKQFIYETRSNLNVVQQMNLKTAALVDILSHVSFTQCLVFSNYQLRVENLHNSLKKYGWTSIYISGAQKQTDRLKALSDLKEFKCRILLSTDLTSRGIDAANVDLVINYDIPTDASVYLHRMGRAGRYGSKGICINIATTKEMASLQSLLGEIGGAGMSIQVLPQDKLPSDLWSASEDVFKVVYASASNGKSTEVSKSVWELKSETEEEKSTKKDVTDNVKMMLDQNNKELEKIEENLKDIDPESLFQSLAAGKVPIEIGEIAENKTQLDAEECLNLLDDNQDLDETMQCESKFKEKKRKRNVSKKTKVKHVNENKVDENTVLTNNIGVLNLGRLLVDNDSLEIPDDVRETTQDMLHRANQDFANISQSVNQSTTSDILQDLSELTINSKNPKMNDNQNSNKIVVEFPEFNIFKLAYEGILEQTNLDWGEFVDFPLVRDRYKYGKDISCPWITYWPSSRNFEQKQKPKKPQSNGCQDGSTQDHTEPTQQKSFQTNNTQQSVPQLNNPSLSQQNVVPTYHTQICYPPQQNVVVPQNTINNRQPTVPQNLQNTVLSQHQTPNNIQPNYGQQRILQPNNTLKSNVQPNNPQQNVLQPNPPRPINFPQPIVTSQSFYPQTVQATLPQQTLLPQNNPQPIYAQQNNMQLLNRPINNLQTMNPSQPMNFYQNNMQPINRPINNFQTINPSQNNAQIYQNNVQPINPPFNNLQTVNPFQNSMQPMNLYQNNIQPVNPPFNNFQTMNPSQNTIQPMNLYQNNMQPLNPPFNNLQTINPFQNNIQPINPYQNNMQPIIPPLNNLQTINPSQNNIQPMNLFQNNVQPMYTPQTNIQPQSNTQSIYPPQIRPQQNNLLPNQPQQNALAQPSNSQLFYSQPNTILPPVPQVNKAQSQLSQQSTSQTLTLRSPSPNQSSSETNEALDKDYQPYFDYYGNCLQLAEACFIDSASFADWYDDWQKRLEQVRSFVQKKIYIQSMTRQD